MNNETIQNAIKQFDSKNVLGSVELFGKQCEIAWNGAASGNENKKEIKNILVAGMGGSALGAYMLQSLNIFTVPITMSHDYSIPQWVGENTLFLAMSYSGGTEETLSATQKALATGATVVCITVGGALAQIATENNLELHNIDTSANPCGQPRFGVGSMMMEMVKVCMSYGVCSLKKEEVESALKELQEHNPLPASPLSGRGETQNAKLEEMWEVAEKLKGKMPVLIFAEHLTNVGRFARNQIHETAKALALTHEIPELNHHLMEGLTFPDTNKEKVTFVFFESETYSQKIQKRIAVTKEVLTKQGIQYITISVVGNSPLTQTLITMLTSMYLAYSLALIHKKDPSDIPWVNYFKEQLVK